MARDPSADLDPLFSVPPGEFTRRRTQLAATLKAAGRREEAAAVQRMKRPSPPLWVINTLAREHIDAVRALVEATDRLKRAQLSGRSAVAEASQAQRRALQALLRSSEAILRRANVSATARTMQRISGTLLGAAADSDAKPDLLRGRLAKERQAPGFEALAGVPPAATTAKGAAPAERRTAKRLHTATRDARRAQAAHEARRAAQARAEELAAKARALAVDATLRQRAAAEAERAVAALEEQLRHATRRARDVRAEARAAEAVAEKARREAARAAVGHASGNTIERLALGPRR
jgi:hypothetical protein